MKILVVDDNPDVVLSIKNGLENSSDEFSIIGADSGEQCLDVLLKEIPDLILLDLMMPKMNGWKVLEIIQGNVKWRDIPIFIITASNDPEFQRTAEDLGIVYIKKPFSIETLKEKIELLENN